LDHRGQVGLAGDVSRQRERAAAERGHLPGGALCARVVERGDDAVAAQPRQRERGGAADAAAASGDDRDLSLQVHGLAPPVGCEWTATLVRAAGAVNGWPLTLPSPRRGEGSSRAGPRAPSPCPLPGGERVARALVPGPPHPALSPEGR